MTRPLVINTVNNGFLVRPFVPERHAEANDEATFVFETHKALFDYIEKTCVINLEATPE